MAKKKTKNYGADQSKKRVKEKPKKGEKTD